MSEKSPVDELKELLPSLEGKLLSADIYHLNAAIKTAERANGNGKNNELYAHIMYLERIAGFDLYYQSNPQAQELFRRSISLLEKSHK